MNLKDVRAYPQPEVIKNLEIDDLFKRVRKVRIILESVDFKKMQKRTAKNNEEYLKNYAEQKSKFEAMDNLLIVSQSTVDRVIHVEDSGIEEISSMAQVKEV